MARNQQRKGKWMLSVSLILIYISGRYYVLTF